MKWLVWGLLVASGSGILYCGYLLLVSYLEVKNQTRVPMFLCAKHGPISHEYLIKFQSSPDTWVEYCSLCFHERLTEAEKIPS